MNKDMIYYLKSIDLEEPSIGKIEGIYSFYETILKEQIQALFVSEYIDLTGGRHYENLWLFTKNLFCEAKNFLNKEDFDMSPIDKIKRLVIKRQEYTSPANDKSRIVIEVSTDNDVKGIFKASKNNCDSLMNIANEFLIPRVKSNIEI